MSTDAHAAIAVPELIPRRRAIRVALGRFARKNPLGAYAGAILAILIIIAVFAPLIAPYGELESDYVQGRGVARLEHPTANHFFGTDDGGRDVFSRILLGSRISIMVGFIAVAMGTGAGSILGAISAYFGGKTDTLIQRVADTIMAFPGLIFILAVVAIIGQGIEQTFLAIGVLLWPSANRVIRSAVLTIRETAYIEAAISIGGSDRRILLRHILPNIMPLIIILASISIGGAILLDASLSFLGLGVAPPRASWGGMLSSQGRQYMKEAPWLALAPGFAISLVVFSFNMFGDALRDVLDPRLRGSR